MQTTFTDHPIAAVFPMMNDAELAELADDIRENGLREPIVLFEGMILDGRNRFRACERADVLPHFDDFEGGDPVRYVVSLNLHRRHLNETQRSMVAARIATLSHGQTQSGQLADVPTQSDAADMLNVGERTVRRAREVIEHGAPELVGAVERGEIAVSAAASIADMEPEEQAAIVALPREERREAIKAHVAHNSGQSEWYTPSTFVEAARAVMGRIDLDPASCETAQEVVKAERWYGLQHDGLATANKWSGRVWMNPPYAQPACAHFIARLIEEFSAGNVSAACVLVNNGTETEWGQSLLEWASAVLFPRGRIRFWHPERESSPLQGQMLCYLGPDAKLFSGAFGDFGQVFRR